MSSEADVTIHLRNSKAEKLLKVSLPIKLLKRKEYKI